MRLTGKTVLVTGAGAGMGLEAAKQLTALGNQVITVARNKARLETEAARPARRVTVCL
jgi:short-subunit dehydrogenase involved in D-alanine esterification of teichoic acids